MSSFIRSLIIAHMCVLLVLSNFYRSAAEAFPDETKALLEKGLTIYEIDQELERLQIRENQMIEQMAVTEESIQRTEAKITQKREHSAKVLRAFYMGERTQLWSLLFSVKRLADAFTVFEYLDSVFKNDMRTLGEYAESVREQRTLHARLVDDHAELTRIKNEFISQRERLIALQEEVEREIADKPDMEEQIHQVTKDWETKGIPLFKTYFKALAGAMQKLPEMVTSNKNSLTYSAEKNPIFQITDQELNEFLRKQDPLFAKFAFVFTEGSILAEGTQDDTSISIQGIYDLIDNEQTNALRFRIEELSFNGYILPDVTRNALENEFDLGFYPQKISPWVKAKSVRVADGKLQVELKIMLSFLNP
jgi:hypothetical protein